MLIAADKLRHFTTQLFLRGGATPYESEVTADHLVLANLKGHDSHGVGMAPSYVHAMRRGNLQPDQHAEIVIDSGAVVLIEGHEGFGQVIGKEAMDIGLQRAQQHGLACVGVRNSYHLGRIGTYGEQCGEAGMVSVHFVIAVGHQPQVSPWAGRTARIQTNPFCCSVPRDNDDPIVLDMATSAIAMGKVRVAYNAGTKVLDGALRDHNGEPTNDPRVAFEDPRGTMGPFGTYKGYGLATMCELLGGALIGQWTMQPGNPRVGTSINHMLTFILKPSVFGPTDKFQEEVSAFVAYMHETEPAKGHDRVRIAGEPEREALAIRSVDGIPIDDKSWNDLCRAAKVAGLSDEEIEEMTI